MSVPGFGGEASLYLTSTHYSSIGAASTDGHAGGAQPVGLSTLTVSPMMLPCGSPNWMCCSPPGWTTNPNNIVSCDAGWGCDVASGGWCTQPCGDTGQPCCDGPDTLAPRWMVVNGQVYVYSPEGLGSDGQPLKEMCRSGVCDRATHRCIACGTQAGKPCCPPDPNYGVARCLDAHLKCQFDSGTDTSGTCVSCGIKGSPACYWGCDSGLGLRNGLCDLCGGSGQLPCDTNGCPPCTSDAADGCSACDKYGCEFPLGLVGGKCMLCGASGQVPCDSGCDPGLAQQGAVCLPCGASGQVPCNGNCDDGFVNKGGICTPCGASGQPPCPKQYPGDTGCRRGLGVRGGVCAMCGRAGQFPCDSGCNDTTMGIQGGRCAYCGVSGKSPCDGGKCNPGLGISGGICLTCGGFTQKPCDVGGCDPGLVIQNGQCISTSPCANIGETCGTQTGPQCCQSSAYPVKCVLGTCQACIPHSQLCTTQNQRCCDPNDICKLDQATEAFVCDIPG